MIPIVLQPLLYAIVWGVNSHSADQSTVMCVAGSEKPKASIFSGYPVSLGM